MAFLCIRMCKAIISLKDQYLIPKDAIKNVYHAASKKIPFAQMQASELGDSAVRFRQNPFTSINAPQTLVCQRRCQ
jgi:hypothetical protein